VPTTAEAGLPGYEVSQFYGIFAPARTPNRILARIESELKHITASVNVKRKLETQGADPYSEKPAELAAFIRENVEIYRQTARTANIRPQ
ncbi:MAG: tripartite tricarboxylate transporter substrate-binding protein, partial [Pseudomonadota bacterium]